jgi:uncharacterized membrane protein YebE (DUF533 family)
MLINVTQNQQLTPKKGQIKMVNTNSVKNLVKILIGAAWLDGRIQPEERQYLLKIAGEKGVAEEPDIKPLLHELVSVSPNDCYLWIKDYLGDNPSNEESQNLIQAISGLIYSDGDVAIEEARMLNKLEQLSHENESGHTAINTILKHIQKLYRAAIVDESPTR